MKKFASAILVAAGMTASFAASAAGTAIVSDSDILTTDCTLLADQVTLNLSANVHGAYDCNLTTNTIGVAACHEGGSRQQSTIDCTGLDTTGDGNLDTFSPSGCADATSQVSIADFKAFGGSSAGGKMGTYDLGAACSDGSVSGVTLFN